MPPIRPVVLAAWASVLTAFAASSIAANTAATPAADTLTSGFARPPASARPFAWWHWVSGNVSREGITADLEAMKRIGLGGAQMFTVEQSDVKGPVVFMSPEWRSLAHFAISESARLGLELDMENGEGWSESGGPWVKPAQSMQQVVWSQLQVSGGQTIALTLPQPQTVRDYYEDIAIVAFPTLPGDAPTGSTITTSSDATEPATTVHPAGLFASLPLPLPDQPRWIAWDFSQPQAFSSLQIAAEAAVHNFSHPSPWKLQVSDDGATYRDIAAVQPNGTNTFPQTSARHFRLWLPVTPQRARARLTFSSIALAGPRIDRPEARVGMAVDRDVSQFTSTPLPPNGAIPPDRIITLTGRSQWQVPPGDWTVLRIGHTSTGITNHPASPATVGLECDKLSRDAVTAHFNQGMMGAVLADAGSLAGVGLKGVLLDSWEAKCENWTPRMRDEFRRRRAYDLDPWLPALTGRIVQSQEATERFLWDYRRVLADLVAENHYGVLRQLSHEHHLQLYAEAAGIGLPTVVDQLQCKGQTDIPMGEFWVNRHDNDDTKEAASAAHIYGQNIAGAEAFTATTENGQWAKDPYSLKAQGDLEFCLGINKFIFHRYAHQPWLDRKPGMSMGPWGTNFERTNTWWDEAGPWMTYLSRCEFLLQRGRFAADVCYYYGEGAPVDFHWDRMHPGIPPGYDFDACDTELLLNGMTVKGGAITLPSGMSYRVLVLPDTDRMTKPVAEAVQRLVQAGATVYGPKPAKSPSLMWKDDEIRAIADQVWGDCDGQNVKSHNYGMGRVVCGMPLEQAIGMPEDFECADPQVHFIHRHDDDAEIYFVSNQRDEERDVLCTFRAAGSAPELWHADSGSQESAAVDRTNDGRTTLPLHFDPSGSVFVIFRHAAAAGDPIVKLRAERELFSTADAARSDSSPGLEPPATNDGAVTLTVWQPGKYIATTATGRTLTAEAEDVPEPIELTGPWRLRFPPKLGAPASAILPQLESWTESKTDGVKYFSGTATYEKDFSLPSGWKAGNTRVILDLGMVKNLAEVKLNGRDLGILWKPPFRIDLTPAMADGINHLDIAITNLWPNRMIGDQKLPEKQRITWASFYPYHADSQLLESGLLGPVLLRAACTVTFHP